MVFLAFEVASIAIVAEPNTKDVHLFYRYNAEMRQNDLIGCCSQYRHHLVNARPIHDDGLGSEDIV